jgi:serine/threonine protein kinase
MGTVYEAVQENLGRRVAVKLLDERLSYEREQLERFRREAEIVAALGHPNIVQVTDFQYSEDLGKQPFLVMELLRGESFGSLIAREGSLPGARVAFIAAQMLSALAAAHRANVVHRDVKPDNVFLLADAAIPDTVKVLDFGIAKLASTDQAKLTGTGAMLGTPAFMAPEQARGADDVDARADIYAVGATMYQALTGKMPFEASSVPALLFAIVERTPPPLRDQRPDLPMDLVAVVERAMAKKREDRFPNADAMRAALAPWSGLPASNPSPAVLQPTLDGLANAPTVASTPPPRAEPATPMVVHHTPIPQPPTPIIPYAPARFRSPPDPALIAAKRKNRTIIILAVLATIALFKIINTLNGDRESRGHHARADDSAAEDFGQSGARSATSLGLNAAARALGEAPTIAPPIPPIVSTTSATAIASTLPVVQKKKRYCGDAGWKSGHDFTGCRTCNPQMFSDDMGLRVKDTSACFAASQHEPPIHETPYYAMSVDDSGHLTMVHSEGGTPSLDRCLLGVMQSVGVKGGPGTFKVGFQGECTKGWAAHCD